jgi:hypothetical protein
MTRVNKVNKVNKINKVNKVDKVNNTFYNNTTKVSCKRVVCVVNTDLCCSINYKSFKGFPIFKSTTKVS